MNEGRCDERLKDRVEESTHLTHTGFHDKTRLKYVEEVTIDTVLFVVYYESRKRELKISTAFVYY
jgi:hypothetical protein